MLLLELASLLRSLLLRRSSGKRRRKCIEVDHAGCTKCMGNGGMEMGCILRNIWSVCVDDIYIYIYIYMDTHTCMCIYIYTYTYYTYMCTYIHICIYVHTERDKCIYIYIYTLILHTYILHTYILHTYRFTHMYRLRHAM